MPTLKNQIETLLRHYAGAYVSGSGKRTLEKQIYYVKTRPTQYPKTLRKAFKEFKIDQRKMNDKEFLKTVYDGKEKWLKETILDLAKKNQGFQHLSGNAIDISVRKLNLPKKQLLKNELTCMGYNVIMEWVAGEKSKYYVDNSKANVFHIDLLEKKSK